ncbi:MAG: hypothetical protein BGO55_19475 [Sphingobacteriales bacterium 50-39]|nr:hypothetical protein [Sphingobacteriales bacterium]OJW58896.1 MAG: hypothetical protein BGO55_19475 [Sphingobacteriales bacterium 50-39]
MKSLCLLLLLFLSFSCVRAQQFEFSKELRFAQYLQDKEAVPEAIRVLELVDTTALSRAQKDSLFYMLGWAAYSTRQLDRSIGSFLKVSVDFSKYDKSRFFAAYCQAFQGRVDSASDGLRQLVLPDSTLRELRSLQLAGIALLKRDYSAFLPQQQQFTYSSYIFEKEERRMQLYYDKLKAFKHKSPALAGIYSALVPGLGKWYAGKKKQGIAAFLPVISLAALTYEAYRKDGVKSARFIGFGTLFTIFYIGDIWGSTLSVKIRRNEFYKEYDTKILFDMHIPLRNFFN